jgi:hypothetical protein
LSACCRSSGDAFCHGPGAYRKNDRQRVPACRYAAKFDDFFKEFQKQKTFAVDTETTSIDPMLAELVGLSFSWKEKRGVLSAGPGARWDKSGWM